MSIKKSKFKETEIGMIPEDWDIQDVKDLGKVITGKTPPTKEGKYFGKDYPFIKIPDMGMCVKVENSETMLSDEGAQYMCSLKLPPDSVMVSCLATIGKVGITAKESFTNQQINSIIPNINKIIPEWIYYYFKNNTEYLESLGGGGSVYTNISKSRFESAKIIFPSLTEQFAIAKILSDLDSKIELNCQMNKTLEAIGQAIFKRWFVGFEFPNEKGKSYKSSSGEMTDSELGEIPKGWKVDNATKLFTLEYGWHLPEWDRKEGDVPVFGSGGLTGYHNSHFVEGPGVIIGRAGKVGPESVYYSHLNFCPIETTFYVLAENKKIIRHLYFFLKTLETVNTGSSVPNLSRRDIHGAKIIIPDVKVIEAFDKIAKTLFDQIKNNEKEIDYLSQIRDSLLPRLMSGKIRVNVK